MKKARIYLQATETECGLAALASLMSCHRVDVGIRDLRQQVDIGRDGADLLALKQIATVYGFQARGFRASPDTDPVDLPMPCVAHWDNAHYVVLERRRGDGIVVVDPATGRETLTAEEVSQHFSGVILHLEPGEDFHPVHREEEGWLRFLFRFLPRRDIAYPALLIVSMLLALLNLVPALVTQTVIDDFLGAGVDDFLLILALIPVAMGLVYWSYTTLRNEFLVWVEKRLEASMTLGVLRRLVSLPFSYFQHRSTGDLLVRMGSMGFLKDLLNSKLLPAVVDGIFLVVYLGALGFVSPYYVVFVIAVLVFHIVLIVITAPKASRLADREIVETSKAQSVLLESLDGVETVKAFGGEQSVAQRYTGVFLDQLSLSVDRIRLDNLLSAAFQTVGYVAPVVLLGIGFVLTQSGELTIGTFVAANAIAAAAIAPIQGIGMNVKDFQTLRVHLDRLKDIVEEEPEDLGLGRRTVDFQGGVELRHVNLTYGGTSPVLRDLDLDIRPGEFVAVVGPSGSGKSTLARTVLGLLEPTSGQVLYDGHDSGTVNIHAIRQQSALVPQNVQGLASSLADNVRFGRPSVTADDIEWALDQAALSEDVAGMRLGLSTPLGEGGMGLSGGQLQRMALARALAGRPKLLVLDEATSNLDSETERVISANLEDLGMSRLVIAHRMSTVLRADRIIFLADGEIRAQGTHGELLSHPGYADFVNYQLNV